MAAADHHRATFKFFSASLLLIADFGLIIAGVVTSIVALEWVAVGVSLFTLMLVLRGWRRSRRRLAPSLDEVNVAVVTTEDPATEPATEDTDVADALTVWELDVEVWVVDEHPHYHMETCTWLGQHKSIPLSLREAHRLGFTGCSICHPDRTLAAQRRS